jgi:serine/threonine protein kinase
VQPRPADDRSSLSSSPENVLYLDSAQANSSTSSSKLNNPDPFAVDGGTTIKSGGLPDTAWQASAAELAKLFVGKQLGNFFIEEALGTGGMAAVFKAIDPLLDRRVALKILPPILAAVPEQVQRFEREAKLAAQMDHENVARVHLYGQDQGLHFIAYEYVEGINLRTLMEKEGGRLKVAEAAKYLHQAALGLAHAAARGVIHRDIKPSNLVINTDGKLKLVDLGLARNSLDISSDALTQAGATLGTFDYLSPEQAIDPRLADVRSDIYSLGCTFYHAMTGIPPVPEGTAARKLQSHHQEMPRDPSELNPEIPPAMVTILSRMMAKKPTDRYQTAEELANDLQLLQKPDAVSVVNIQRQSEAVSPSLPWYWQALALVILVAGIVLWESLSTPSNNSSPPSLWAEFAEPASSNPLPSAPANDKTNTVTEAPITLEIDSLDDLNQALKRTGGGTLLLKRPVYEVRSANALLIKQGNWTIRPAGNKPITLRLLDTSDTNLIEVKSGSLQLQRLVLELTGLSSSGIQSYSGSQVTLDQCELIRQTGSNVTTRSIAPAAFIRVSSTNDTTIPGSIDIKGSIWHPSVGIGILFDAPGYIQIEDSWIAPQYQLLVLPGLGSSSPKRLVNLRQTSVAMPSDACFKVVGKSPVHLDLERCIFSRMTSSMADDPTLLVMEDASVIDLQSTDSLYHRIGHYGALQRAINTRDVIARDWRQLRQTLGRCKDEGTSLVTRSPWLESRPWQRFQDGHKTLALAPKNDYQQFGPAELLGTRFTFNDTVAKNSKSNAPKGKRLLVVDGVGEEPNTFSTLNSAIGSIADEEETTIQIAMQGTVTVKPTELGNSKIILQAAEGFKPEVTFHRDTVAGPDGETHLFRLHDGDLTIENLKFRLEALRDPAKALSLVAVTGVGKCKLKDTIVTLKGSLELVTNVFSINDPTGMASPQNINKPATMGTARLECTDSIIRGHGQVLHVQAGRPFAIHLQQTGIALEGTVCLLEGSRSDMSMPAESALLQLDRCTAYHTRGLLQLRTSLAMPQLMPLRAIINQTVLGMGDSQPMVKVDLQQSETDLKRKLFWQGKRNLYLGATSSLMSYQQLDRDTSATLYDATLWSEYWGSEDEQAQIMKTLPLAGLTRQVALHEWEAVDFSVKLEGNNNFGTRDMGLPMEGMPRTP